MTMSCPVCGRAVRDGAAYCGGCGTEVADPAMSVAGPSAPVPPAVPAPAAVAAPMAQRVDATSAPSPAGPGSGMEASGVASPDVAGWAVVRVLRLGLAVLVGASGLAQLAMAWIDPWSSYAVFIALGYEWAADLLGGFGRSGSWALAAILVGIAVLLVWRPRAGALVSVAFFGVGTIGWLVTFAPIADSLEFALLVAQGPSPPFAFVAAVALLVALRGDG